MFTNSLNVNGTSFFGYEIHSTVNDLVNFIKCDPNKEKSGDGKVNVEFDLEYNGINFTIYDWKEYRDITDNEDIYFHIGTLTEADSKVIANLFEDNNFEVINSNKLFNNI